MAGDVVIHRAYFGEAENLETLHARLYRIECSLRDLQERDKPAADPWKGGKVVGLNDQLTAFHQELINHFAMWIKMAGNPETVDPREVLRWLESRYPHPFSH